MDLTFAHFFVNKIIIFLKNINIGNDYGKRITGDVLEIICGMRMHIPIDQLKPCGITEKQDINCLNIKDKLLK